MSYYAKRFFGQQGIVTDGLKLWLDASNPASYSGTGTTWFDLSGNANNGTMANGVVPLSNAMRFDGVNDYVNLGNKFNPDLQNFSVSIWFYFTSMPTTASYAMVAKGNVGSLNRGFSAFVSIAGIVFFRVGDSVLRAASSIPIDNTFANKWNNLVGVINRNEGIVDIYLNGSNANKIAGGGGATTDSLIGMGSINTTEVASIGAAFLLTNPSNFHKGDLNDVFIYQNKALTADEVLINFNATKSKYGL